MYLSIISPVYRAEKILPELVKEIEEAAKQITVSFEIILVEDCGPDNSWAVIEDLCQLYPYVKGVHLSRNFGQQYALNAGFDLSSGEWIVTLDCDLQDTPSLIVDLYNKAKEGYDVVFASRTNRQDDFIKRIGSKVFNRLLGILTDTVQDGSIANFVIYHRKVVDAMRAMGDYRRYYPLMNHWVGFRRFVLPVPHAPRADEQRSSYSFRKRLQLGLNTVIAFSDKPLRMIMLFGVYVALLAFLFAIVLVINYLTTGIIVSGWLTLFVSLWFIAGIIISLMGLIGIYIGKIYEQAKGRPSYLVSDKLNFE